jgi:hypothetical protein
VSDSKQKREIERERERERESGEKIKLAAHHLFAKHHHCFGAEAAPALLEHLPQVGPHQVDHQRPVAADASEPVIMRNTSCGKREGGGVNDGEDGLIVEGERLRGKVNVRCPLRCWYTLNSSGKCARFTFVLSCVKVSQ